jgi:hypothetical protein
MNGIIEPVLDALIDVLREDGIHAMPVEKLASVIQGVSENDVVNTLENLLSDYNALSDMILKIHYVDEVGIIIIYMYLI